MSDSYRQGRSMITRISLRGNEGSITLTIPTELAERHGLTAGGECSIVESQSGILLTAYDPALERAMAVYRRGADRNRNALRELSE